MNEVNTITHENQSVSTVDARHDGSVLAIISRAASDPSVDVAKLEKLLEMQERITARAALEEFNRSFARLAGKLPRIKRDGTVCYEDKQGNKKPAFKFARWEDIMRHIQPMLDEEGFALGFETAPRADGGGLLVTGTLVHTGGASRTASIPLPLDTSGGKNNLQGYGSTFSYGRRYCSTMLLNIVTEGEDDDGVRGAQEFITDEAVTAIAAELKRRKIPEVEFVVAMGVRSLEEIQVKDLPAARNAIRSYKPRAPAETGP
jgi:hypothetical protein